MQCGGSSSSKVLLSWDLWKAYLADPPHQSSGGNKITDWVDPNDKSGEFKRHVSTFRDWISTDKGAKFPAEKGRYHLYVNYACPWATRALIARKLKGLEDIVSFSSVHWHMGEKGESFLLLYPLLERRES
jgi:glutathionyl-hydroquinone reductase